MQGLRDAIELIQKAAQEATAAQLVPIETHGRLAYVRLGEEISAYPLPPAPRRHLVESLVDLIAYVQDWQSENADRRIVVWHSHHGSVIAVLDDEDRRDTVTLELREPEEFRTLLLLSDHPDADRVDPPSLNTVSKIVAFINRARVLIVGRAVAENAMKFEGSKVRSRLSNASLFGLQTVARADYFLDAFAVCVQSDTANRRQQVQRVLVLSGFQSRQRLARESCDVRPGPEMAHLRHGTGAVLLHFRLCGHAFPPDNWYGLNPAKPRLRSRPAPGGRDRERSN